MLSAKLKAQLDVERVDPELYKRVNKFLNWSRRHRFDYWKDVGGYRCELFKIYPSTGDWVTVGVASGASLSEAISGALDQFESRNESF